MFKFSLKDIEKRRANPEVSTVDKEFSAMEIHADVFQPQTDLCNLYVRTSARRARLVCTVRKFKEMGRAAFNPLEKLTDPIYNEESGVYFLDNVPCKIFGAYTKAEQLQKPSMSKPIISKPR